MKPVLPNVVPQSRDIIRRSVDLVTSDVIVRDGGGQFVANLGKGDFEVLEDGVKQDLVTFVLADEEYGLDVRVVQEIIRLAEITQVPRSPGFIKGVINLRGRIIPVVDLKRKLNLGEVDGAARQSRIVVVKVRDRLIGLLVDGASQVLKVPVASIEPPPEEVVEIDANYVRGVAKLDRRLIILMDLPKVLALELKEEVS